MGSALQQVKIAIVGSGPGGLSAACHAAELGVSHVLLEAQQHLSNTIYRYQKGKHVMAEPDVLPLRSPLDFEAGTREVILGGWDDTTAQLQVNVAHGAEVTAITRQDDGAFLIDTPKGQWQAERVVLGIGLQGNLRKMGVEGDSLPNVQYQLDDPDEYNSERIIVVGAGDAAIENAVALSHGNAVTILNRRDEFARAKDANNRAILDAIERENIRCLYKASPTKVEQQDDGSLLMSLKTADGETTLACDRIIARLGAIPPRRLVESFGIEFPSDDPAAVPAISERYESNVPGLYIVGALGGYPLIKQAINQGYEVVETIEGREVEPADEPLLRAKFETLPGFNSVSDTIEEIQQKIPLLQPITALQLREFLLDSTLHVPAAGDVVFEKNDYTNSFYTIVRGTVDIQIDADNPDKVITIGEGNFFGEMSLISGRRRSATVLAGDGAVLVETPRRSTVKLINSVEAVRRVIDEAFISRAIQAQIAPGVSEELLQDLVEHATVASFGAGEVLFSEGDAGDALHLIRSGSVTVSRDLGEREVVLAYVPAGRYVGEMALMSAAPRSATVRAAVATETIRLEGTAFQRLLDAEPRIKATLKTKYKERMAATEKRSGRSEHNSVLSFLVSQGLGEATDVLLIDESLCVRCDQCEKACADTHGNLSRLDREAGPTIDQLHVPTSCRHCEHPHCMKDCPPDAIHRNPNGEVFISDACIGCGNCERNCPYGVIQMGVPSEKRPSLWQWLILGRGQEPGSGLAGTGKAKKAVKCDMCKGLAGGPACVRACPTGAAIRMDPESFFAIAEAAN
ncbi:cyclic nucleotide-binding domain-containing protein [bacterium]|nr:cyclic nucleotide-binding domain-containing protein [bacterium]